MKKKVIAWTAAVLIVALVSAAFLRPAPSEFGYGDRLYTPVREELELLSGGEHFIVENLGVKMYNGTALELRIIQKHPERMYTRSSMRFVNNGAPDEDESSGIFERYENGEWREVGEAGPNFVYFGGPPGEYNARTIRYYYLLDDSRYCDDEGAFIYPLEFGVLGSPGRYRVTLYFRECSAEPYTTSDELIEVCFEYEVEATDAAFDVAGVYTLAEGNWGAAELFLRSNYASPAERDSENHIYIQDNAAPYLDTSSLALEKRVGLGYEPVETGEGTGLELTVAGLHFFHDLPPYFRYEPDWYFSTPDKRIDRLGYYEFTFLGEDFDPTAEYRVTMEFVENSDGSGERYTLALKLKLS